MAGPRCTLLPAAQNMLALCALVASMHTIVLIDSCCDARVVFAEALKSSPTFSGAALQSHEYEWTLDTDMSDNFQGSDAKWARSLGGWTGSPPGRFDDGNAVVADGMLSLVAKSPGCSKLNTTGAFHGKVLQILSHAEAPGPTGWAWAECAKQCVHHNMCGYWVVSAAKGCVLKQGADKYIVAEAFTSTVIAHGHRDEDCRAESFAAAAFGAVGDCDCGYSTDITTGMVVSQKAASFGFYEVSATIGRGNVMTSFWLQGHAGEINIFESIHPQQQQQQQRLATNMHCFDVTSDGSNTKSMEELVAEDIVAKLDLSVPHIFGLDWTSEHLKYYIDGSLVRTITKSSVGNDECMSDAMNVVLSMETVSRHGTPEQGFADVVSQVHYFRRFERGALKTASTPAPGAGGTASQQCATQCARRRGARATHSRDAAHSSKTRRHAGGLPARLMPSDADKAQAGVADADVDADAASSVIITGNLLDSRRRSRRTGTMQENAKNTHSGGGVGDTAMLLSLAGVAIVVATVVAIGMVAAVADAKRPTRGGAVAPVELDDVHVLGATFATCTPAFDVPDRDRKASLRRRSTFVPTRGLDLRRSRCSSSGGGGGFRRMSSVSASPRVGLADAAVAAASLGMRRASQLAMVQLPPLVALDEALCTHLA